ncbi:MAG: hemagglutinin repeat-containing protein, partial [Fusobacteriaceae bacterium]
MNFFKVAEGMLKHSLKNKRRITMSLIVSFLITGEIGFVSEEVLARDLRTRNKAENEIKTDPNGGPGMSKSANGTDVVQINDASPGGISHNKFIDFSVGAENGVIFNNNATNEPVNTNIGGTVTHNPNLSKPATAILSEVTGSKVSNVNGVVEVAGQRADFILANENGIVVNGGSFLNTSGVTLSTGKPTVSGSDINLDVKQGNILVDEYGVATRGSYFNIIAKTIELKGRIAPLDQENNVSPNLDPIMDSNITLLAGQNNATLKNNAGSRSLEYKVTGHEKNGEKYGIYADHLGSMYGKNIKLISTTEGLGVRHEGLIKGMQDIEILSSGDVVVAGLIAGRNINLEGKGNFESLSSTYKDSSNVDVNYSIKSGKHVGDITLTFVDGDITLESCLDANGNDEGSVKIVGKNLVLKADSNAEILGKTSIDIKLSGSLNIEANVHPVDKKRGTDKAPLVIVKDSNNNVVVKDPENGRIYDSSELEWESPKIFANVINIEANDLTNEGIIFAKSNSIAEKSLNLNIANTLTNKKLIYSDGVVDIKARELINEKDSVIRGSSLLIASNNIENRGELRQNSNTGEASDRAGKLVIDIKDGSFVNYGTVAGYSVEIKGKGFLLNEKDGRIETSTADYPRGLGDITIDVKRLDNKGDILASSKGVGRDCDIRINTEIFSNLSGGKIYAEAGGIEITSTVSDISNSGEIIAKKDLILKSENNTINSGILGGQNITVISEKGNFENYGKVAAVEKLMIHVNNLINAGSPEEIIKYLDAFNSYVKESLEEVELIKNDLKDKIKKDPQNEGLRETLKYYEKVEIELVQLRNEIDRLGSLGILSGNDVEIKTKENVANKGIIKANTDILMETGKDLINSGIIEANNNATLRAVGDVKNSQKIYAGNNLEISAKQFSSTWKDENSIKYANLIKEYDKDELEKAENKIVELEKKLLITTDKDEIEKIKTELESYRAIKSKQAKLKAEIAGMEGLGVAEAKNIKIETTDNIENDGIIIANNNLEMKSGKDINNRGSVSVGENADISGKNYTNNSMTVGKNLNIKVEKDFESKSLKVGNDLSIEAEKVKIEKDLYTGKDTNIKLSGAGSKTEFVENSEVNIKGNLDVKGGDFSNKGTVVVGEKLSVDTLADPLNAGSKLFENIGSLEVGSDININSQGVDNKGDMLSGGKLNVDAGTGLFNTEQKLQAKDGADIKSQGFTNKGQAIFGGDTNIDARDGAVENKSLEVVGNTTITTTSDFKNLEKMQNTEKLTIKAKTFENVGDILNKGLDATISEKSENTGKIDVSGDLTLKGVEDNSSFINTGEVLVQDKGIIDIKGSLENTGKIATGDDFKIDAGRLINKSGGVVQSGKQLDITLKETLVNEDKAKIYGGKINIDGTNPGFKEFTNKGEIVSNGTLTVDLGKNDIDIQLNNTSKMSSQELMTLKTGGNINNEGKLQNLGGLDFTASKNIVNKGMLVTNDSINFKANNVINEEGKTIWAAKNVVIDANDTIHNKRGARIESKANMDLTADSVINSAGLISSGKDMNIRTNKLKNESYISGSDELKMIGYDSATSTRGSVIFQNVGLCKYRQVQVGPMPLYESDQHVLAGDRATIQSGGNLSIKGKDINTSSDIENISGTVSAKNNITIVGNVKNITVTPKEKTVEEYLSEIESVKGVYETTIGGKPTKGSYIDGRGSLDDLLPDIMENSHSLSALKGACGGRPQLELLLNQALGDDWMSKNTIPRSVYEANKTKPVVFTPNASVQAKILAGGTITQTGGVVENKGTSEYKEKTNVQEVTIGEHKVDGTSSNLVINPKDPNSITGLDNIKVVHKEEIQTGTVTLNGVEINASSGETVKAIAVAGTISPIQYIEIPVGTDGMFKPGEPKEDGKITFKYETNIEFINVDDYYGSDYFFKQIGYDPNQTSTVIGDAYYEKELINRTAQEGLGYSGEIGTDQIKEMLDNSVEVKDELGLVVGVPLTADQINALDEDIIWYVEMEVEGSLVLVPQVYFGKTTRIEMAQNDQGTGTGSVIKGNSIDIDATNVVNMNGTIAAKETIAIKSENDIINNVEDGGPGGIHAGKDITLDAGKDIEMIGGIVVSKEGGVDVKAKGDIKIETSLGYDENGDQAIANAAGIIAKGDVSTTSGGKTTITGGVISSSEGSVGITGNNVEILDQNLVKADIIDGGVAAKTTSSGSIIVAGKNTTINSETDVTIKGSDVGAKEKVSISAKDDVNIVDGQEYAYQKKSEKHSDASSTGSSSSEKTTSTSKGSNIGGTEGVDINSGKNTTIKGSTIGAGGDGININAGESVKILDGKDTMTSKSESESVSWLGYSKSSESEKSSTSKGSELNSNSTININAGKDVKAVGAQINAVGDVEVTAKENVTFEAGKNEHEKNTSAFSIGVTSASAKTGVAGASATAEWDPFAGGKTQASTGKIPEVAAESQNMNSAGRAGKNYMDSIASTQVTVGYANNKSSEKETTWTASEVNTDGSFKIKAGETADIGGVNVDVGQDYKVTAGNIETTKYVDVSEKESSGVSVGVKIENKVTSSIADATNKGAEIYDSAASGDVNEALVAAQTIGTVSNLVFGDLAANTTSASAEFQKNSSSSKTEKENITKVNAGGTVSFETTKGDIDLKGVQIDAADASIVSAGSINITDAKETHKESSEGVGGSIGYTNTTAVSAISGASNQTGIAAQGNYNNNKVDNELSHASSINVTNKVTIKSEKDTNLVGATIEANDVDLDIKGNLNIETVADKINESRVEAYGGFDLSAGVATNTIVTADIGLSAGGGKIYKEGTEITTVSGITAKNSVNGKVEGDANLNGGTIGSETGKGNLEIGGDLNVTDKTSDLKGGGAIIGFSGGTKGGGIQGEVGDTIDKKVTGKGAVGLDTESLTVKGDVKANGQVVTKEELNKDIENSLVVERDVYKKGGTFSATASALPGKDTAGTSTSNAGTDSFSSGGSTRSSNQGDGGTNTPTRTSQVDGGSNAPSKNTQTDGKSNAPSKNTQTDGGSNAPSKNTQTDGGIKPSKNTQTDGESGAGGNKQTQPQKDVTTIVQPVKPKVEAPDSNTINQQDRNINPKKETAIVEKSKSVEQGKVVTPVVDKTIKTDTDTGGYKKNEKTGNWERSNSDPGAILTGGGITNKKSLDGFREGANSLIDGPKTKVETPKVVPVDGQYKKNAETGKWESTKPDTSKSKVETPKVAPVVDKTIKTDTDTGGYKKNEKTGNWERSNSDPGAILTGGGITNKDSLNGFREGANSLIDGPKTKVETPKVVPVDGQYKKNAETGKWENSNTTPVSNQTVDTVNKKKETATLEKSKSVEQGKTVTPVVDKTTTKTDTEAGGYKKNTETGNWERSNSDPGAILTGGGITNKDSLNGFREGANSLVDGSKTKVETQGKAKVEEGKSVEQGKTVTPEVGGNKKTQESRDLTTNVEQVKSKLEVQESTKKQAEDKIINQNKETATVEQGKAKVEEGKSVEQGKMVTPEVGRNKKTQESRDLTTNVEQAKSKLEVQESTKKQAEDKIINQNKETATVEQGKAKVEEGKSVEQGKMVTPEVGGNKKTQESRDLTTNVEQAKSKLEAQESTKKQAEDKTINQNKETATVEQGKTVTPVSDQTTEAKIEKGGYVKNEKTGNWERSNSDPGAILTGGGITNKDSLNGFREGANSLVEKTPKPKVDTGVVDGASKPKVDTGVVDGASKPKVDTGVVDGASKPKVDTDTSKGAQKDVDVHSKKQESTIANDPARQNRVREIMAETIFDGKERTLEQQKELAIKAIAQERKEKSDRDKGIVPNKESAGKDKNSTEINKKKSKKDEKLAKEIAKNKELGETIFYVPKEDLPKKGEVEKNTTPSDGIYVNKPTDDTYSTPMAKKNRTKDSEKAPEVPPKLKVVDTDGAHEKRETMEKQSAGDEEIGATGGKPKVNLDEMSTKEFNKYVKEKQKEKEKQDKIDKKNAKKEEQIAKEKAKNQEKLAKELSKQIAKAEKTGESVFYASEEGGNEGAQLIKNKKEFKSYINEINKAEKKQNKIDKKNDESNIKLSKQKAQGQEELSKPKAIESLKIQGEGASTSSGEVQEFATGKEFKAHIDKMNKEHATKKEIEQKQIIQKEKNKAELSKEIFKAKEAGETTFYKIKDGGAE